MAEKININGVEYTKEDACVHPYINMDHVCIICDRGWIFEGYKRADGTLAEAHVVRNRGNHPGIGGFTDPDHKNDYVLDYIGDLQIAPHAVIATIPLRW